MLKNPDESAGSRSAMRIEHAHRLRCKRDEQQERHHDTGQDHRELELAFNLRIPGKNEGDDAWCEDGPDDADSSHEGDDQRGQAIGEKIRFFLAATCQRLGKRRDEGGGQRALGEKVAQEVWDPVRRNERVVGHPCAEEPGKYRLPYKACNTAEKYGEAYHARPAHNLSVGGVRFGH